MTLNEAVKRQHISEAKDRVVEAARAVVPEICIHRAKFNRAIKQSLQAALRELAELEKE